MGVLRFLDVVPTQFHPNSWAALQAFRLICDVFRLMSSPQSFLFYFNSRSAQLVGWLSLSSHPHSILFASYTSSYKYFKDIFSKNLLSQMTSLIFMITRISQNFPELGHPPAIHRGWGHPWPLRYRDFSCIRPTSKYTAYSKNSRCIPIAPLLGWFFWYVAFKLLVFSSLCWLCLFFCLFVRVMAQINPDAANMLNNYTAKRPGDRRGHLKWLVGFLLLSKVLWCLQIFFEVLKNLL